MQVRAGRLAGLAAVLTAGVLVAAPSLAGPQPTHHEAPEPTVTRTPAESPTLRRDLGTPPDHPPGNPPSCLIPAESPTTPLAQPTPIEPETSCELPDFCVQPAVDRPGLSTCSPLEERVRSQVVEPPRARIR